MVDTCDKMIDSALKLEVVQQFDKTRNAIENKFWNSTPEAWHINDPSVFGAMMYQKTMADLEVMNEVDSINN
jgi:hypothetical protein